MVRRRWLEWAGMFIFGSDTQGPRNMEIENKYPEGVLACHIDRADDLEDSHGASCYWAYIVLSSR